MESGNLHSEEKTRVLLVDDDKALRRLIGEFLDAHGFQVLEADSGPAMRAVLEQQPVDLVVLDVMMPGKTGWEVARNLRHDPATEQIKIVMLTAIGEQVNEMKSPLYGADAHIDKPFEFDTLERTIQRLLD